MRDLIGRRRFLAGGLSLAGALAAPSVLAAGSANCRRLAFRNLHTGETVDTEYWSDGAYMPDALSGIDKVLRDFRTGDIHPIDRRLLDLLTHLRGTLETSEPFHVISAYRSPKSNAMLHETTSGVASHSLHMDGMAMDIRVPGRALKAVHQAALNLQLGGVGFYPASDFVHVDVGRVRRWG